MSYAETEEVNNLNIETFLEEQGQIKEFNLEHYQKDFRNLRILDNETQTSILQELYIYVNLLIDIKHEQEKKQMQTNSVC